MAPVPRSPRRTTRPGVAGRPRVEHLHVGRLASSRFRQFGLCGETPFRELLLVVWPQVSGSSLAYNPTQALIRRNSMRWALALAFGCAVVSSVSAQQNPAPPPAMRLTSTAFADGTPIPNRFTQAGEQVSPALSWSNTPPGTTSFVLHMYDPDVSRNKTTEGQLHWLVWNIPPTATGLPEGVPQGAERPDGSRQTSASGPVYRGPGAPAAGPQHHYTFEVFALDTKIDVPAGGEPFETRVNVLKAIQGHVLGKAVYVGLFHRPQ